MPEQQLKTKYGYFTADGKEYIITRPDTPRPWCNFLFNDIYHAIVSQTGGGFSYYKDPKYNRILRYDHLHTDRPGRYLYLRDKDSGKYWSATWQPIRQKLDRYTCRHGLGYTTISGSKEKISSSITYFVTQNDPAEIMLITVKNESKQKRKITLFPFVELVSGDQVLEQIYRNIQSLYNKASLDKKLNAIVAQKIPNPHRMTENYSFFSSSLKIDGFDCHKEKFFGRYASPSNPEVVIKGKCKNSDVWGEDMVATFEHNLSLAPGEEKTFTLVLGFAEEIKQIEPLLKKFNDPKLAQAELERIKKYWQEKISALTVDTPDNNFNLITNIWGRYQLFAITHWRGTSAYHGGEGGLGYRDTAQDIEGLLALDLGIAMDKMKKILYYQYNSGHAVSGFSDIEGPWDNMGEGMVLGKADVAVWLPYTVISYVKETGDLDFLKKEVEFFNGGKATVYEHILRAVRYIWSKRGSHGLPLIFKADWNDAYDQVGKKGKGESVWLAMALCRAFKQIKELAEHIGDQAVAAEMQEKYDALSKIINDTGWDGEWYLAAYNDNGLKIGSKENKEGNVPLNSQTWAILSEIVPKERKASILDKIDNYLNTDYGPALFLPSYTHYNPGIGRVTSFAPGTKENAAVFSHACAFKIVADCTIGRGDKAFETFSQLLPLSPTKLKDLELYKAEPYVFAEYVIGPGHPTNFGEGSFTWNTGTAPWMFIAATEWVLGARRDFGGLRIDPCLPKHWKKASIRRPFRGAIYNIKIENPNGVEKGVRSITVDGKKIEGNLIEPLNDGKEQQVQVLMG